MYSPDVVYKIKTKDQLHFTAKVLEEDSTHIRIKSILDGQEDIISKDNVLKARPANQNSTGDSNVD